MRSLLVLFAIAPTVFAADTVAKPVSFYRDVRPIFVTHCQGCHQPAKAQGKYVMTDFASLLKAGESEKTAITPGKPEASYLLDELKIKEGKAKMPKNRDALNPLQIETITKWVAAGAIDDTPATAKAPAIDTEHPPVYNAAPVITSLAYSKDGSMIAVTGYHEVLLHKADGSGLVGRLVGLSERVQSLAFSPDGLWLAVAGGSPGQFGEIQIWNVAKQKLKLAAPLTFDTVYGISWSPDGSILAVGCADNTVRAIDADTGKQVLQMGTHSDWAVGTVFSRDGVHLVSVARDMTMKLTDVATERFVDNITSITPGALKGGLMAVDRRPKTVQELQKVPEDTKGAKPMVYDELIIAGSDGTPRLYKMHRETPRKIGDDANRIRVYKPLPGRVSSIKFDTDGSRFAASSSLDGKGEVRVYDTDSGAMVECEGITGPIYAVAWSPDGKQIASGGFDGTVWLHDAATGEVVKKFEVAPKK
ncbi:hypothetical protein BH11PLA2_BH11PLA2_24420 [soil metagenome]